MSEANEVLDLDALVPAAAKIKYEGQEIEVKAPKVADVLKLAALGKPMQKIDELEEAEVAKLLADLSAMIATIVPELAGKDLNVDQLLKLTELLSKMVIPPDAKELAEKGITPAGITDPKDQ